MEREPQGSLSALKSTLNEEEVLEALKFWSQLGRVFMRDGQLFEKFDLQTFVCVDLSQAFPLRCFSKQKGNEYA